MFGLKDKKNASSTHTVVPGLVLYYYASCPFCRRVRQHIQQQGWVIEERDVLQDSGWRKELMEGGGKTQVPCLKIESPDASANWMYESMDIVNYLNDRLD